MLPTRNDDRLPLHRMTSKPKPTKSSHYVHGILKGLSALLATDAASKLTKDTSSSIAKVGAHSIPFSVLGAPSAIANLLSPKDASPIQHEYHHGASEAAMCILSTGRQAVYFPVAAL